MNKSTILLFIIIASGLKLTSQNIYPSERSFTLEPKFLTGTLGAINLSGGGLTVGLDVMETYDNFTFGIEGGYKYIYNSDSSLSSSVNFGLNTGYNIRFLNGIRVTPTIGAIIDTTLIDFNNSFELMGCVDTTFHIYNRNLLLLRAGVNYSFNEGSYYTFKIGIKRSLPFLIPVNRVRLGLFFSPNNFSPDADGISDNLNIIIKTDQRYSVKRWSVTVLNEEKSIVKTWFGNGAIPKKIEWAGISNKGQLIESASRYRVTVKTEDYKGRFSEARNSFLSDILVDKLGSKYRIKISSIIFPPDSADFTRLDETDIENNRAIIKKLVNKLNKYPNYNIRIEGHGNIINWQTEESFNKENRDILIPLTLKRAEAVRQMLIDEGMSSSRISVAGVGGSYPITSFSDKENNWKNRRVEFILLK